MQDTAAGPDGSTTLHALRQRIQRNVTIDEKGCWHWQLRTDPVEGYGRMSVAGTIRLAHRVSYEAFVAPIPDGLTIDHLCRVRDCVNPEHLEAVTNQVNMRRSPFTQASVNAAKSHCAQGHEFSEANTYVYRGSRICRACAAAYTAKYRARRAQKAS